LRTGHAGLNGFLARIKAAPSARCEACHVPETVEPYLLRCRRFTHARHSLRMQIRKPLSLPLLLNKPSSVPALLQFIHNTLRFPQYSDDAYSPPLHTPKDP
ncbi:hypothetical protein AURDEDRAFT_56982, partial [Auricularia subglabra TFB-10046 SS5]